MGENWLSKKTCNFVLIRLIQISSPNHYALWNALSAETLAGDLRGEFGELVNVTINRIRSEKEINHLLKEIKNNPPHILGISVEIGSLEWANKFLEGYNKLTFCSNCPPLLVIGNKLPTYFPAYFLEKCPNAIVVTGEGEESLRGIVWHVAGNKSLEAVPNLVFRNAHKELYWTFSKHPALNLLMHPPAVDTVPETVQNGGNALLQASRGCSWSQCSYCTIKSFRKGRKWEGFPVKRVLENIERLVSLGVTELEFADDEFFGGVDSGHLERIYDIANGIEKIRIESRKDITFRIFLIPHTIYRKNRLKENEAVKKLILRLKEVGLAKIYFGAESGCSSQLQRYRRGYTLEELEANIRILRDELKIEIDVGFVMFDPNLSLQEMLSNIRFFRKWNLIKSNQWPFRPLIVNVGSYIYENLKNSGLLTNLDINYMSYGYKFMDKNVQKIFSIIDSLSLPSRQIFYALKVISKRQFSREKKDKETILAQDYVEAEGEIYLEVMENLVQYFQGASSNTIEDILAAAQQRIDKLILRVQQDIINGRIIDRYGFIFEQIDKYHAKKSVVFQNRLKIIDELVCCKRKGKLYENCLWERRRDNLEFIKDGLHNISEHLPKTMQAKKFREEGE